MRLCLNWKTGPTVWCGSGRGIRNDSPCRITDKIIYYTKGYNHRDVTHRAELNQA